MYTFYNNDLWSAVCYRSENRSLPPEPDKRLGRLQFLDPIRYQASYDPFDPFTISESPGSIPDNLSDSVNNGILVPVLLSQETICPNGRMQSVLIKGIYPEQEVLALASSKLKSDGVDIPAIIGSSICCVSQ